MANKERATLFTTGNTVTRDLVHGTWYIKTTRLRVVNIYLQIYKYEKNRDDTSSMTLKQANVYLHVQVCEGRKTFICYLVGVNVLSLSLSRSLSFSLPLFLFLLFISSALCHSLSQTHTHTHTVTFQSVVKDSAYGLESGPR